MKKLIIFFYAITLSVGASGQLNMGIRAGKTVDAFIGFDIESIRIEYNYVLPYSKTTKPTASIVSLGYNIILTNKDIDSYDNISQIVLTPSIGVSLYHYSIFTKDKEIVKGTSLSYGTELAIRQYAGEFFLYTKRYAAKEITYGLGLRCLIGNL